MLNDLAFTMTLKNILLAYLRSLRTELGALLYESTYSILEYVYQDLIRMGVRDHLVGYSFGISEELNSFSSQLMYCLGTS